MEHSLSDYHKIYRALQGSLSSLTREGEEVENLIHNHIIEAARNLNQAFEFELLRKNKIYD